MGLVSPLGVGTEQTWQAILAGRSGIGPITLFDPSRYSTRFAGEVKNFDPLEWLDRKDVKKCGRFIQLALAATAMADTLVTIPAKSLAVALDDYIRQSGVQLIYNTDDVAGLASHAVRGETSVNHSSTLSGICTRPVAVPLAEGRAATQVG